MTTRYAATVTVPGHLTATWQADRLRAAGFAVLDVSPRGLGGTIAVQADADDLETFLGDLEGWAPRGSIIADAAEAVVDL